MGGPHWMEAWDEVMEAPCVCFGRDLRVTWSSPRLRRVLQRAKVGASFAQVFPHLTDQEGALAASFADGPLPEGGIEAGRWVEFQRGPEGDEILALFNPLPVEEEVRLSAAGLATLSHEIRTPLNAIVGMGELLEQTKLDTVQRRYVGVCRAAAEGLLELINNFLDMQKLNAGRLEIEAAPFHLWELLDAVVEIASMRTNQKGLALLTEIEEGTPLRVEGDAHRLRQVLLNLVANAAKFTDHGHVTLSVRRGPRPAQLLFVVEDTGQGVPPDRVSKLFMPFWQFSSERAKRSQGTGLGLSISRQLVERMGGHIWYEPRPEGGSRFSFTAKLPPADATVKDPVEPAPDVRGARTLLVCDRPRPRAAMARMLRSFELSVTEADDAQGAAQELSAARTPFQFVFVDADALSTTARANLRRSAGPARVMYCATPTELTALEARGEQPDAYVLNPVRRLELYQTINATVSTSARPVSRGLVHLYGPASGLRRRVLIVDDNPDNLLMVQAMLEAGGHEAVAVIDSDEGLKRINEGGFDLVLLDLNMPGRSGYDVVALARAHEREVERAPAPIVAFSASGSPADVEACLAAGFTAHVKKPITLQRITEVVDRFARPADGEPSGPHPVAEVAAPLPPTGSLLPQVPSETVKNAIANLLPEFFERRRQDVLRLREALAAEDHEVFRFIGHQLAGTGSTFGFPELTDLGAALNQAGHQKDTATARTVVRDIETVLRGADPDFAAVDGAK